MWILLHKYTKREDACLKKAYLIMEDGTLFSGISFGAVPPCTDELPDHSTLRFAGETVFNTSMAGYHEIFSDPSYTGQIVIMTYPHIGSYGTDDAWTESHVSQSDRRFHLAGLIVRSLYKGPIPPGRVSLEDMMIQQGIPGLTEVDTRRLTIDIRERGSRNGVLLSPRENTITDEEIDAACRWLKEFPPMTGRNLADAAGITEEETIHPQGSIHFALVDCGIKEQIIRCLTARDVRITLFPASASAEQILSCRPDACLYSNGPGDPSMHGHQIHVIQQLIGKIPVFGICFGHQLIAQALGGKIFKMEFGHHGGNHPVIDTVTRKAFVTSQNHGFAVSQDSLPEEIVPWFINANDQTIEGLFHSNLPVLSVQFHPEAAPGPQESAWIFDRFLEETRRNIST